MSIPLTNSNEYAHDSFIAAKKQLYSNENIDIMKEAITLNSTITCPQCHFQKAEIMPTDACQYFYECTNCQALLKPSQGDCCVFCSYGSVKCPPIQLNKTCCA